MKWLTLLLICFSCFLCSVFPAFADDIPDARKLQMINEAIAKQNTNIAAMKAELARNPNNPNRALLGNYYATASGDRTEAYNQLDSYMKGLVDKFESSFTRNVGGAVALATGMGRARGMFIIEIDRSNQFIKEELLPEKARLEKLIAANPWQEALGRWKRKKFVYDLELEGNGKAALSVVELPPDIKADGCIEENTIIFYFASRCSMCP